jgi:hypothetical protein
VLGLTPAFVATFQNRKNYAVLKHGRITAVTKQAEAPLFPLWVEDRGLSFLRAFLILNVIFVRMIPLSRYGRIGLGLIFGLMVVSGAIATIRHRFLMYLVIVLTVLEFAADLIIEFRPSFGQRGAGILRSRLPDSRSWS